MQYISGFLTHPAGSAILIARSSFTRFAINAAGMMLLVLSIGVTTVFPQASSSTAELRGTVTDQADAAIPGAKITLTDLSKGTTRTTTSDAEGGYLFVQLLPGAYEIKVEAPNFAPGSTRLELTVGQQANIPIRLAAGKVEIAVDVVAGAEVVETERTQQSSVVESRQIQNLPISRRNYLDYALLTPGVTDSDNIADASDFRVAQTPQTGLSFGGNNGRGNSVALDGAETLNSSGGVRGGLSQEAVQEFQVLRNSFSAEFGGASGGVVNIVSKTGGNEFHGSAFGFFRNQRFDARNAFDFNPQGKSDFDRQQFGGSVGGPLRRDRTFFFTAAERFNQGETTFVNLLNDPNIFRLPTTQANFFDFLSGTGNPQLVGTAAVLRDRLSINPATPNGARTIGLFTDATGQFPFDSNQTTFSARVDHNFSDRSTGYIRANINDFVFENQAAGALTAVSRGRTLDSFSGDILASHNYQFSNTFFNELKLQFGYQRFSVIPNDKIGPELNIEGFGNFGRDIFLPSSTLERHYDIADNLTKIAGDHTIKFGFAINLLDVNTSSETFFGGRFNFGTAIPLINLIEPNAAAQPTNPLNLFLLNTPGNPYRTDANNNRIADILDAPISALQAFNLGLPIVYQQGFGDPLAQSWTARNSFYVQDTWKLAPNFTFNYGLRYYISEEPFLLPTYHKDFQPRAGFAWDPFNNGRTAIRGGAGIFVGPINNAVANVTTELGGFGDPSNINIVLATATSAAFGLPTSFAVYQTTLALTNGFTRTITPADVFAVPPPTSGVLPGLTPTRIIPRPGAPLEVRFRAEPHYRSPTTYQASLGVQQDLGGGFSLDVGYLFTRGLYLTRNRDLNPVSATGAPHPLNPNGGPTFRRVVAPPATPAPVRCPPDSASPLTSDFRDCRRLQDNIYESSANSFYHAGTLQVMKRFSNYIGLNAHYTYSKAIDEVTDFNSDFSAQDPLNLRLDRALSAFDQRHRFVVSGIFASPFDHPLARNWQLAPIFIAGSGRPFNLLLGFDANGDGRSQSDRPGQAGRNTGTGEPFYSFDLRLARRFAVREQRFFEVTIEGFNLFNRTNFAGVNNIVGATFATATDFRVNGDRTKAPTQPLGFTSAADARKLQFGVRFNF